MTRPLTFCAALCAALLFTPLVRAQTDLYVGSNTPANTLDLTNGTNAYANTYVGFTVDASNNALGVYNAGTLLTNTSDLFVGDRGSGNAMTVADGAVVAAVTSYMGSWAVSSNNSVLVTGTNSMWQNSSVLHVGYSGNGNRLVISNGGTALNAIGSIGTFGSDNIVEVTGAGSLWTNSGDLRLGYEDNANGNQLVVSNGGTVAANRLWVGYWESLSNSLVVTGTNSLLQASNVVVGRAGAGNQLVVSDGGTLASAQYGNLGQNFSSSNNVALVTGAGSLWTNALDLFIGGLGSGNRLTVSNAGTVANAAGVVGSSSIGNGNEVVVTGTNSFWTNALDLTIGNSGSSNSMTVSNGGMVASGIGYIGNTNTASNNSVLVTGTNSLWTNTGNLYVGNFGSGNNLVISNGGTVAGGNGYFGYTSTASNNTVLVTGSNSLWTNSGNLTVGNNGSGNSMVITNGGTVTSATGSLGSLGTATGNSALVTGAGSSWGTLASSLYVGDAGSNNLLTVADGGSVSTGPGAALYVGNTGSGNRLVVSNGGTATAGNSYLGYGATASNNTALVTGAGSTWTNFGVLLVGREGGNNNLVVSNGGTVTASGFDTSAIGFASDNNSVLVTGSNSLLSVTGGGTTLIVGYDGASNSLVIADGGRVLSISGIIGFTNTAGLAIDNSALVTGAGSRWDNVNGLFVGFKSGNSTLTVADGGTVDAGFTFDIASQAGSSGTLNIGGFGTNDAAGTINAPKITFGAGTGTINFNQSNATTISAVISGNGSVNQLGSGTTILAGTNTYSGMTTVNRGTLVVQGQSSLGTSSVTVNGGTLEASGVFTEFPLALNAGNMTLTGAESSWNTGTNPLSVGNSSQGASVVVEGGASVVSEGLLALGMNAGASNNSVLVTGTGSTWSNSSNLTIGDAGEGTLTVANGGSVSANAVIIASQAGSSGTLNFGSLGGSDTAGNFLPPVISFGSGSGTINFNQTDTVAATGFSGNGSLNQLGSGTTILMGTNTYSGTTTVNSGTLVVQGQSSLGTSSVTVNGGTLEASGVFTEFPLALNAGNMTLTGAGSSWNTGTNPLSVGNSSQGASVVVEGGASVVSEGLLALGMNAGASNNSVLVTGSNSSWSTAVGNNTWTVLVGDYGSGNTLEVVDGGQVSAPWFYIGNLVGSSNNSVLVAGSGSTLSNSENLYIGLSGSGNSLVISNGGKVTSFSAWLGLNAGSSNNSVLVTGSGSSLSNNSIAGTSIGNAGEGTLTVASGGVWGKCIAVARPSARTDQIKTNRGCGK